MAQFETNKKQWSKWHDRLHCYLSRDQDLLPIGASLLIAVSGGQDSMALLGLLIDLKRLYKWRLEVWHGNHGWHASSEEVLQGVHQWCKKNNIPFNSSKAKKNEAKNEKSAREWRYKELTITAEQLSLRTPDKPFHRVITGHTGSDRAETFLLNLARGTDLSGLSSMRSIRLLNSSYHQNQLKLVRPLLGFTRKQTEQICSELNLPVWLDPTNNDKSFSRNKLRHEVIPVLESLHPGSSLRIASLAKRLEKHKDDQESFALLAMELLSSENSLDRKALSKLSISARSTIIYLWLKKAGGPAISACQLEELSHKIDAEKPNGSLDISKGWKILWNKKVINASSI